MLVASARRRPTMQRVSLEVASRHSKKRNAQRKAAQLENIRNIRKEKAKRKLESDDEEPQDVNKLLEVLSKKTQMSQHFFLTFISSS